MYNHIHWPNESEDCHWFHPFLRGGPKGILGFEGLSGMIAAGGELNSLNFSHKKAQDEIATDSFKAPISARESFPDWHDIFDAFLWPKKLRLLGFSGFENRSYSNPRRATSSSSQPR